MSSIDWFARSLAAASVVISLFALGWAVASWRLAGSVVRVHALLYRRSLVVRVFNAGRMADTIEEAVLGGLRHGRHGKSLSDALGLPLRLEPGQAKQWVLDAALLPVATVASASAGWESLRLLLGSMRQRRAEVIPVAKGSPETVGWRFVPRRVKATRYLPLSAAAGAFAVEAAPSLAPLVLAPLIIRVLARGYAAMIAGKGNSRLRFERWVLAAGGVVVIVQAVAARAHVPAEPAGAWPGWLLVAYTCVAFLLAVPGLAPQAVAITRGLRAFARQTVAALPARRRAPAAQPSDTGSSVAPDRLT